MRRHSALVKKLILGMAATLLMAVASVTSRAQFMTPVPPYFSPFTVPSVFDGLDWLNDRGGTLFDGVAGSTNYGNLNVFPQRQGRNNVGNNGTPTPALDPHRGLLRWVFPRTLDLSANGGIFSCIVDNPYPGWDKSNASIFFDSSQPIDAISRWMGGGFIIPPLANRTGQNGFSFAFTPADPTNPVDPNPPANLQGDYGYAFATHNDFVVNRGANPSGPATVAELQNMPNVDYNVYKAVNDVLTTDYDNLAHPIAQWTIGTRLNGNYAAGSLVHYDGQPNPPDPTIAPNKRVVKYKVDIYSPGSGTVLPDGFNHPNVTRAFVRVSWKNTVNTATNTINPGTKVGTTYTAGAGGVNDPQNSRIYLVDLSQPGWIHLGAANSSPASFPYGGGSDQIVVTMFSLTPDDPTDSNIYLQSPLVTADAVRFTEQDTSSTPDPTNPPPVTNLGPLNDPLNPNLIFVGRSGRFLGPIVGTNKFTTDGSTLWYCVREEVIPNQARISTDPTQPTNSTTNPLIIDPAVTATAPVFYCLTNENNVITQATNTTAEVDTVSKNRVVWRYVGFPDGGVATSFTSPVIANVRARDGKYHVMVYFCSTSNNEQGGQVGRIYALDALGDLNTDPTMRTTQTTAYWTYPSLRPLEKEEIATPTGTAAAGTSFPNQYHDPNYTHYATTDPENLYPLKDPTKYGTNWTMGYWWADDQDLFTSGSKHYYDGDIVSGTGTTKTVKTDTQIVVGGITGAPVVLNDPSNSTGPMILVVPSLDGRMYCFDAGGRGDFDNTKILPTPPSDPTNPTLTQGTLSVLGINYQIPGTTQRLWTWPHYGADAFHQIYDLVTTSNYAGQTNSFSDEDSKGAMPFSLAYDSTFGQDDPRNALLVSAGVNGENGEFGTGHVYGIIPGHDGPVTIGSNNTPHWTVNVNNGLILTSSDRRYWSWPFESDSTTISSSQPLTDIPGVISIYPGAQSGASGGYAYFASGGRIYSLHLPNAFPGTGHYTPDVNWVFPHTPLNYIPFQDPNDTTSASYSQGFAPKGVAAMPAAVAGTTNDMVYGLLTDGTMLGIEANPVTRPNGQYTTNLIAANTSLLGSFTESAPTLTAIAPDPYLNSFARPAPGTAVQLLTSEPALLFGDDSGAVYAMGTSPRQYTDGAGGFISKLPILYFTQDTGEAVATQPALAASTRNLAAGAVPPKDSAGHVLNGQPYYGGYFLLGSNDGQLRAFSLGRFANGYGDTAGAGEPQSSLGGDNVVSIDVREFDAYTNYRNNPPAGYNTNEYSGIAPLPGQTANSYTPARKEDDTKYSNTATPAKSNVPSTNPVNLALDQGGNLYLAASGVYHAQPEDNSLTEYGTTLPIITVTFTISQPGLPAETRVVTVAPVTRNPNNKGLRVNDPWPDDLAISNSDKNNLHIYGVDNNNPSGTTNPTGDGSASQRLTGPQQNVYPWAAKTLVQIIPRNVNGQTTWAPNSTGYTVTVKAEIAQQVHLQGLSGNSSRRVTNDAFLKMGERNSPGMSNSPYPPDVNDTNNSAIYQSPPRGLYITNPLGLSVRSYNNVNDMTGLGPLTSPNIIGWAGPVDNPITNVDEVTGNGMFVGVSSTNPANNAGYRKPLFAPFGMWQDASTPRYLVNKGGQQATGIYLLDRSDLARVTGQPVHVRTTMAPLHWNGTAQSVLNPLPFEELPNRDKIGGTPDYRPIDTRNAIFSVKGVNATQGNAALTPPTNPTVGSGNVDPAARIPVPTPVDLTIPLPKFTPANVNRGAVQVNFRGKNIVIGDTFTDNAGYLRGYHNVGNQTGAIDNRVSGDILGPLDTASGLAASNPSGGTPSGGYVGDVAVNVVPLGGTSTNNNVARFLRGATTSVISRQFQTGLAVAPNFQTRVLETTLDMGKVPHGTGYSDLVGGSYLYRYPFAPSGTGPYINTGASPTLTYSPWDNDGQFTFAGGLGITQGSSSGLPTMGRYFRPFTWVNESNVNLVNPRVSKLIGPHSGDTSATPNLSDVISNASLGVNPGFGIANSVRLTSDQVNNLLSPPLFATPFGQSTAGTGFLGNIGVVSSFDHDSYAQGILNELNLYPLFNPAVDALTVKNATDLFNAGLLATDLYAKGGNVPFAVGVQGRPTIRKPRVGDGSGSIATVPDQPHDFLSGLLNNNPGNPNIYQQLQAAGIFNLPSMAVAVPMGTPTGTYSATIYPYEDGLPLQWLDWLSASSAAGSAAQTQYLGNSDDILNTNSAGVPTEPYAKPAPKLRVSVQENQLTQGAIAGAMPQIDVRNLATTLNGQTFYDAMGFNVQPAAVMLPGPITGTNFYNKVMLYWTTNRATNVPTSGAYPTPSTPYNLAYSSVFTPYSAATGYFRGDAQFAGSLNTDTFGIGLPQWWGTPDKSGTQRPYALLPGFNGSVPDQYLNLFQLPAGTQANPNTFRMASPAISLATNYNVATGQYDVTDPEAYLVAQGSMDVNKLLPSGVIDVNTQTYTRTFYTSLNNKSGSSILGAPDYGLPGSVDGLLSFANDPAVPKLSPRPLLVKLHGEQINGTATDIKFLYVFWHSGSQGRTSLFYNVNALSGNLGGTFPANGFSVLGDRKLDTPSALTWQSDPYPVYRRVYDPTTNQIVNAVDVMFTGTLKNRQSVEILCARYRIVTADSLANGSQPALKVGQLVAMPFPTVHQDILTRIPGTTTWAARDAGWFLPADTQANDTVANRYMRIYLQPTGSGVSYQINPAIDNTATQQGTQRGRVDTASGLVYFNALAIDPATGKVAVNAAGRPLYGGGQLVVDPKSGTVSFPNITPGKYDTIRASYTPYLTRVSTSRDDFNIDRDITDLWQANGGPLTNGTNFFGTNGLLASLLIQPRPSTASAGQNYAPTYILDRAPNMRASLLSPQVLFNPNGAGIVPTTNPLQQPPIDRKWVLFRKSDSENRVKTVFMKAQRLMIRLPRPVALSAVNGTGTSPNAAQAITNLSVVRYDTTSNSFVPLRRGYEVDWVRGRIYFQEEDEGDIVQVNYTYFDPGSSTTGNSGSLFYRVDWGDEISSAYHPYDANSKWTGDDTTSEIQMPTSSTVNEGAVSAFKDPYIDKLWVFWSSQRGGGIGPAARIIPSTDLFYQTLAPQFYPTATNQY